MTKPTPSNIEKNITSDSPLMLKCDRTGAIEYANFEFVNLCEYEIDEIIGKDISVFTHPDTPSTVFNHIWGNLFKKKRTYAIFNNLTKSGDHFWLQGNFDFKVNEITREIENIYVYYSKVSEDAKVELAVLYKRIKDIEDHADIDVAENYLKGFLDEKSLTYDDFIENYIH